MNGHFEPGEVVFGNWQLTRLIGEGSYGKVYEAQREDFGTIYKAAIKIITIPQSDSEIKSARAEGMDEESLTDYFRSFAEEIVQEFVLMSKLKGNSNVVSYEDHTVARHTDGIGWDIIIRMELLTPLLDYVQQNQLARKDVIQLGIDICKALELCQKYNIIHRDIKSENIFVSPAGDYKLGDFGIARTVEKTTGEMSKKGTYTYMAPEVYKEEPYNSSVDIYSLGIVMYRLLNENRAPFLPAYPAPITHSHREAALSRQISGEALPSPKNADGRLSEIVLKACAYDPRDRYSSPMQMRQELEAILYDQEEAPAIYPQGDTVPIKSVENIPTEESSKEDDNTLSMFDNPAGEEAARQDSAIPEGQGSETLGKEDRKGKEGKKGHKKLPLVPLVAVACVALALVGGILFFVTRGGEAPGSTYRVENGYYLSNKDSVPVGEPDAPLDPGQVYDDITYIPEMFHANYALPGGDEALAQYQQDMDYMTYQDYNGITEEYTTRDLTAIPHAIRVGSYCPIPNVPDQDAYSWMQLYFQTYTGNLYTLTCSYWLEGDKLVLRPVREVSYDKETSTKTYDFTDITLEYAYAFQGTSLTLSRDGKSATMSAAYFSGKEASPYLHADGYLAKGSPQIDTITNIRLYWSEERNSAWIHLSFDDRDGKNINSSKCAATLTEDGLFTFTIPYDQELPYRAEPKTYQFVYFFSEEAGTEGLVLTDGRQTYLYTVSQSEYQEYKLSDVLDDTSLEDLTDSQVEELINTQSSILNDLETAFLDADVEADIDKDTGKVTMDSSFLFDTNDATLSDSGKQYLDGFLDVYSSVITSDQYSGAVASILIEGHTDTNGEYDYNMTLSEQRAQAVADYCLERQPGLANILQTRGCSYDDPVYDASGNVDMAASRRVLFKFILNTGH